MNITVETTVQAPMARVWAAWNDPRAIEQWNAASPDWHTPSARVDMRELGYECVEFAASARASHFVLHKRP